jgi:hypothetical protein
MVDDIDRLFAAPTLPEQPLLDEMDDVDRLFYEPPAAPVEAALPPKKPGLVKSTVVAPVRGGATAIASVGRGSELIDETLGPAASAAHKATHPGYAVVSTLAEVLRKPAEKYVETHPRAVEDILEPGSAMGFLQGALERIGEVGGQFVAMPAAPLQHIGEQAETLERKEIKPTLANVAIPAAINTGLDYLGFLKVLKFAGITGDAAEKTAKSLRQVGVDYLTTTGIETGTEVVQELVTLYNAKLQADESLALTPEERYQLVQVGVDTMIGMAGLGAPSAYSQARDAQQGVNPDGTNIFDNDPKLSTEPGGTPPTTTEASSLPPPSTPVLPAPLTEGAPPLTPGVTPNAEAQERQGQGPSSTPAVPQQVATTEKPPEPIEPAATPTPSEEKPTIGSMGDMAFTQLTEEEKTFAYGKTDLNFGPYVQIGPQLGTTLGGKFIDIESGDKSYIKFDDNADRLKNEELAGKLYELAGVRTLEPRIVPDVEGKQALQTFWAEDLGSTEQVVWKAKRGFVVDAWLANWDVVGLDFTNIQADPAGNLVRTDVGGALRYRAMGAPKPPLTAEVQELTSLRDPNVNPQAAAVFANVTSADIVQGAQELAKISDDDIRSLVIQYGPEGALQKEGLADLLIARKSWIVENWAVKEPEDSYFNEPEDIDEDAIPVNTKLSTDDPSLWPVPQAAQTELGGSLDEVHAELINEVDAHLRFLSLQGKTAQGPIEVAGMKTKSMEPKYSKATPSLFDGDVSEKHLPAGGVVAGPYDAATHAPGTVVEIGIKEALAENPTAPIRFIRPLLENFIKTLAPDMKVVLTTLQVLNTKTKKQEPIGSTWGAHVSFDKANGLVAIAINIPAIQASPLLSKADAAKREVAERQLLFATVAHEFGHALMNNAFFRAANYTKIAVMKEYRTWLSFMKNASVAEFYREFPTGPHSELMLDFIKKEKPGAATMKVLDYFKEADLNYALSFNEWFAMQVARWATQRQEMLRVKTVDPEARKFWIGVAELLKQFYTKFLKKFAPSGTMATYLDALVAEVHAQAKAKELGLTPGTQRAADLGLAVPKTIVQTSGKTKKGKPPAVKTDDTLAPKMLAAQRLKNLMAWFGDGAVKKADGTPKPLYRGQKVLTRYFKPSSTYAHAIFLSEKKGFSAGWKSAHPEIEWEHEYDDKIQWSDKWGPEKGLYKVYTNIKNPFDFRNPQHVAMLEKKLKDKKIIAVKQQSGGTLPVASAMKAVKEGGWPVLEGQTVQNIIRFELGHDGFYMQEGGAVNLGVYDPTSVKSVSANVGTFSKEHVELDLQSDPTSQGAQDARNTGATPRMVRDVDNFTSANVGWGKLWGIIDPLNFLTPLQIAERFGIKMFKEYINRVQQYANTKAKIQEQAAELTDDVRKLSSAQNRRLTTFTYDVSTSSDELGRRLTEEELAKLRQRHGVTDHEMEIWRKIDASFTKVLTDYESAMVYEAGRLFTRDGKQFRQAWIAAKDQAQQTALIKLLAKDTKAGTALLAQMNKIQEQFGKLREKNYFPRSRFGQYALRLVATQDGVQYDGKTFKKGETMDFRQYESEKDRLADARLVKRDAPAGSRVSVGLIDDTTYSFMGVPQVVIEMLKNSDLLNLTDVQKNRLNDIALSMLPGRSFMKHLKERKGVKGYSEDLLRTYSNYMLKASGHIARAEHAQDMSEALALFNAETKSLQLEDTDTRDALLSYGKRHLDYLFNPDNDLAALRAIGFQWYLGFSVKSALVNLTQVPLVTYPVLAARFGDGAAVKQITRAYKDVRLSLHKMKQLEAQVVQALQQANAEGLTNESFANSLAGADENIVLQNLAPKGVTDSILQKATYYGGWMFRHAEEYNRRVTLVAGMRAALDEGLPYEQAYAAAKEAVQKSQFEYAKWNRPEFMRGKKSALFLFWQYIQHASYLAFNGANSKEGRRAAVRYMLLMLLVGGTQGLPFMETLMDILDFTGTKAKELLGVSNPRMALREDLRELLVELDVNPDLAMYGLSSHYGLGPLHALGLAGVPVPNVDISGSVSMGRPIPWFNDLFTETTNVDAKVGKNLLNVLGPIAAIPYQVIRAVESNDPNTWKNVERTLPVFLKNISKGYRWLSEGQETSLGRAELMSFTDTQGRAEAIAQTLGFTPARLSRKYDLIGSQKEASLYWNVKRKMVMDDIADAFASGDLDAINAAMQEMRTFNSQLHDVPELRPLMLSPRTIKRSMDMRAKSRRQREMGLPVERMYRPLYQEIAKQHPGADTP